jgi:hypothetical protein
MKPHRSDQKFVDMIRPNMATGPWIAGGAVLKWKRGLSVNQSDIDVFFKDVHQFSDTFSRLMRSADFEVCWDSANAITLRQRDHTQKIQLIKLKYFESADAVLSAFDFSVCKMITDGIDTKVGSNTIADIKNKQLNVDEINPLAIIKRIMKYSSYGYSPSPTLIDMLREQDDNIKWDDWHQIGDGGEYDNAF